MTDQDTLPQPTQESVICSLVFGGERGQIIAGMVDPKYFSNPYSQIAERAIIYRRTYNRAPGKEHADDIFADLLAPTAKDAKTMRRILLSLARQSEKLNEDYVLDSVQKFIRFATLKTAILTAGLSMQQAGAKALPSIEKTLSDALATQFEPLDPGTFLGDEQRALQFLDRRESDSLKLGIKPLDDMGLTPTRGELWVLLGPRGSGKSMGCAHVSSSAILQNLKVLDVSLEMNEARRAQRMFQNLYAIAKRHDSYDRTRLEVDEAGHLVRLATECFSPEQSFGDRRKARAFILDQMRGGDLNLWNLCMKSFPSGTMTIQKLRAHLDFLRQVRNFVPDVVIVDYPMLMSIDMRDPRVSIGRNMVDLRGMAQELNFMLVAPHQGNREGERAKRLEGYHAAEDISIIATADTVISINSTPQEKRHRLSRLYISKARNDRDKLEFLISQDYGTAQFVLDVASATPGDYWTQLEHLEGSATPAEPDED